MVVYRAGHLYFFNDTATTEIYTLSLHDALPIFSSPAEQLLEPLLETRALGQVSDLLDAVPESFVRRDERAAGDRRAQDRKSTRLNSSHANISYAVFCLKKKPHIEHSHVSPTDTQ